MSATVIGFPSRASDKAARIRARWPSEWAQGARVGFGGARVGSSYPRGFCAWPLDRRNAWFSGFNRGYCDRERAHG
jgi:hypothetical protein